MTNNPELENELARLARVIYGENAVEFLVGALSSVTSETQVNALLGKLKKMLEPVPFDPSIIVRPKRPK